MSVTIDGFLYVFNNTFFESQTNKMFRFMLFTIAIFPFVILRVINADMDSSMDTKPTNFTLVEEQCNSTFIINPEYLVSLTETGSFPDEIDITPKCYINCLLEILNIIDENSNINADIAVQQLNLMRENQKMNSTQVIVNDCIEERDETSKCEKSYGFAKCIMETIIEMYDN